MTTATFLNFHDPAWVYVSLPLMAMLVSYATKVVAIKMMFKPLEFKGKPPYLGWQGQIPRRAAKMAAIAVDSITEGILKPEELFDRIDVDRMVDELEEPLAESAELMLEEVMERESPGIWRSLPEPVRGAARARVRGQVPEVTRRMFGEFRADIGRFFDLKHMVVTNLTRDKVLLNKMFQDMAAPEFRFIATSGIWTGLAVGLAQMLSYGATGIHFIIPIFGGLAGGLTDYIALTLIFRPKRRRAVIWPWRWQGLFHKRRDEVTEIYGDLMADEILSPRALIESVLSGPASDRLVELVVAEVDRTLDRQAGAATPLVRLAVGPAGYSRLKRELAAAAVAQLPESAALIEDYLARTMDIRGLIVERLRLLDTDGYENLLRPAFKDDEWVIVAVGAMLGFLIGEMQVQGILRLA